MNKYILEFLECYVDRETNKQSGVRKVNKYFKYLNKLCKSNVLDDGQCDLIAQNMIDYGNYIIKLLSQCPYLEIRLSQPMQQTIIHKYPTPKRGSDAIGFVYEEPEELEEDFD